MRFGVCQRSIHSIVSPCYTSRLFQYSLTSFCPSPGSTPVSDCSAFRSKLSAKWEKWCPWITYVIFDAAHLISDIEPDYCLWRARMFQVSNSIPRISGALRRKWSSWPDVVTCLFANPVSSTGDRAGTAPSFRHDRMAFFSVLTDLRRNRWRWAGTKALNIVWECVSECQWPRSWM
jgi:hypothetical protein